MAISKAEHSEQQRREMFKASGLMPVAIDNCKLNRMALKRLLDAMEKEVRK